MRLIIERLVHTEVCIPGELRALHVSAAAKSRNRSSAVLPAIKPLPAFNLYVSPHNHGAAEVGQLLSAEAQRANVKLNVTTTLEDDTSTPMLLYLNDRTHDNATDLHAELEGTLRTERRVVLVHEERHGHGALPFVEILMRTPRNLITLNVYKDIATPLYDGEAHRHVSVLATLNVIMGNEDGDEMSSPFSKLIARWAREMQAAMRRLAPSGASGADEAIEEDMPGVLLHPTMRTRFQTFRAKVAMRLGKVRRARRSLAGFDAESGARELTFKESPEEPEAAKAELRTPSSRV